MRIEDLNWMDVENYLKQDDRLILVIGACEQHGYLSLLTDIRIPLALADAASQQAGVLVAPPLNYGASPYFHCLSRHLQPAPNHPDGHRGGFAPFSLWAGLPAVSYPEWAWRQQRRQNPLGRTRQPAW